MRVLYLLLLLFISSFGYAQDLRSPQIIPSPGKARKPHVVLPRKTSSVSKFQGNIHFPPQQAGSRPMLIKSVGDNTLIHGCLISSSSWVDEEQYGIYGLVATSGFHAKALRTGNDFKSSAGVCAGGEYYSFYFEEWLGHVFYVACSVYNTATWELEQLFEPAAEWSNVPYSSALAFDEQSGKVYAVTYMDAEGHCALSTLNTESGTFAQIAPLPRPYLTLAFSPDGVLYGISESGELYSIDKTNGESTLIGNTRLQPQFAQSMTFDPNTGLLYWAFINAASSALYQLNTVTATPYKLFDMPDHQEFVGLFIDKEATPATSPRPVTQLSFTPSAPGSLTGAVSCVAPSKTAGNSSLTSPVKVTISSGDDVIYEAAVRPGSTVMKENVTFDANKLYTLFATASNENGKSPKQSITVFIGKDSAGSPVNVKLQVNDNKLATLTWENPVAGNNDGFIDPSSTTYKIVRHAGDDEGVSVTKTPIQGNSFSETLPSVTAEYSYTVTSYTDGIEGGSANSGKVLAIGAYELPFSDDFQNGELANQLYTFVDVDNDGHDNQGCWFWKADEKLMQYCSDGVHAGNDWLITPAIHLDGKHVYHLKYKVNMGAASNLRVTLGTSPDPATHTVTIDQGEGMSGMVQTDYEAQFKVNKVNGDADYYIGFHNYSNPGSTYFNLFSISITEGIETNVPDSVTSLVVTADPNGENRATLRFTVPERLVNEEPVMGNVDVRILRNNALVATLEKKAGERVTYVDEDASNDNNTYEVRAFVGNKEGLPNSATIWVGYDLALPVNDFKLVSADGNMHASLSWEAPEKGVHDGYFNSGEVTYTVWRSMDGKNFTPIAQNLKVLSYKDEEIADAVVVLQEVVYYVVTAHTRAGQSKEVSAFLTLGTPYRLPVGESFANGQFDMVPWTFHALEGQLGWETMRSDKEGGGFPQDNDKGFVKFSNHWNESHVSSRLMTPVVSLEGTSEPAFSFYMFHWEENTVPADNKQTRLYIEVAPEDGGFEEPIAEITAAADKYGWVEHRVSLDKYKDCKYIKIGLRGEISNDWMYYYVDNIHFDELLDQDLSVESFDGDTDSQAGDTCHYTVSCLNRGRETADNYTISLYQNTTLVGEAEGGKIAPGEARSFVIPFVINATLVDKTISLHAVINYEGDQNMANNTSVKIKNKVKESWLPQPKELIAANKGNDVRLTWKAYDLPTADESTLDTFDEYEPFATAGFGNWISYDGDGLGSGKINTLPDFENQNTNMAFQVWNPGKLDGVNEQTYPDLMPHSGEQCLIAWYANTSIDWNTPVNNDYLISPEVKGGTQISFYIKKANRIEKGETYQIMYSSTTNSPDAFVVLSEGEAPSDWTEMTATLPDEAKYFAIHYTASLKVGILVDDIQYVSALYGLHQKGFNVFRDGGQINNALLNQPEYVDHGPSSGNHYYQVSAVYDRGESAATEKVSVEVTNKIDNVEIIEADSYTVYSVDGKLIGRNMKRIPNLPKGIYIINQQKVTIK